MKKKKIRDVSGTGKIEFHYCFPCFYFILICERWGDRELELIVFFFSSSDDDILENISISMILSVRLKVIFFEIIAISKFRYF